MVARFVKAEPIKKPLKMSGYGKQGSGKTGTSLLFAEGLATRRNGRFCVVDTDPGSGTAPYLMHNPSREYHPAPFDFDVLRSRSLADIWEAINALDKGTTCVVLDNLTHLWEATRDAWSARNPDKDPKIQDWGPIKRPYKRIVKFLMDSDKDVILLGREKAVFGDDDGKMVNLGVAMKADGDTPYEPDICLHFFLVGKQGGLAQQDVAFFGEKDRYSIFQGKTFTKPNYNTLAPLIPFLGTDAPPSEDDEERAAQDSDLLDDSEKVANREAKSATIMADLAAKAEAATTMEALGAVTKEAVKLKRSMVGTHIDAVRQVFNAKSAQLAQKIAGSV